MALYVFESKSGDTVERWYPMEDAPKKRLLRSAVFAAFAVSGVILVAGKLIFRFMGITPDDFRIGGGGSCS